MLLVKINKKWRMYAIDARFHTHQWDTSDAGVFCIRILTHVSRTKIHMQKSHVNPALRHEVK